MTEPVLVVDDLHVTFPTPDGPLSAVRGVSFEVAQHEVLGVVGESGSGKSVTMLAAMGLLSRNAKITGSVRYRGTELLGLSDREMRPYRGAGIGMIFQDPMTSLNPVFTVGDQIAEAVRAHRDVSRDEARERSLELLRLVEIPDPEERVDQYPHEYSGGMRQRAMIAMAMANEPSVLIADEPTTALDVTIQAHVLEVLVRVKEATGTAIILITHDLGVVARVADRMVVMYGGRAVETGASLDLLTQPRHPYTLGLLRSLPHLDRDDDRLVPIPGSPPSMLRPPGGCSFHPRCFMATDRCRVDDPPLRPVDGGEEGDRASACHFADEVPQVDVVVGEGS